MEKRGERSFGHNGHQGAGRKPMTTEQIDVLKERLDTAAKLGQEEMVNGGGGITFPTRSRSKQARALRKSHYEQPSL